MTRTIRLFCVVLVILVCSSLAPLPGVQAFQSSRTGWLRVDKPGVEVRRSNTGTWAAVRRETLIGVGDGIRTQEQGQASLQFGELYSLDLLPNSEAKLNKYTDEAGGTSLVIEIAQGFAASHRKATAADKTLIQLALPAFLATVIDGDTSLRVEANGRSALIAAANGKASVTGKAGAVAAVDPVTGLRAASGEALSDVITAISFPTLDSGLDGCAASIDLPGDIRLNVRLGADLTFPRVGSLEHKTPVHAMGMVSRGGWYRIQFRGGFGWIRIDGLAVENCAGLRVFADKYGPEDSTKYEFVGDPPEATALPSTPAAS